jgi:hypothetical protein
MPEHQARRLGAVAVVEPGESVPFTVSWRLRGGGAPASADLGTATVALPVSD